MYVGGMVEWEPLAAVKKFSNDIALMFAKTIVPGKILRRFRCDALLSNSDYDQMVQRFEDLRIVHCFEVQMENKLLTAFEDDDYFLR